MPTEHRTIEIAGQTLPVLLVREARRSVRMTLGKKAVLVRWPLRLGAPAEAQQWERLRQWLEQQHRQRAAVLQRYVLQPYTDGQVLRVGQRQYVLQLLPTHGQTGSAQLQQGTICLRVNEDWPADQRQQAIRTLLSRTVAQDYLPYIRQRVTQLNEQHFRRTVKAIRLKYNTSNWGSCSSSGNINLSTRLLFAPAPVIDYVIVHELAHLVEMNHSARFWTLVATALPDYEQQVDWLRAHGRECDF